MTPREKLEKSIREQLARKPLGAHQAGSLALDLFLLSSVHGSREEPGVRELLVAYEEYLRDHGMADVIARQMDYAIGLARPGRLLDESENVIISLCTNIEALRLLGFPLDEAEYLAYQETLLRCFREHAHLMRETAQGAVKDWNADWWFFRELLRPRARSGARTPVRLKHPQRDVGVLVENTPYVGRYEVRELADGRHELLVWYCGEQVTEPIAEPPNYDSFTDRIARRVLQRLVAEQLGA